MAFHNVLPLAGEFTSSHRLGARILVGGIFNTINPSVYRSREKPVPAKVHYAQKDLADRAHLAGLRHHLTHSVSGVEREGMSGPHFSCTGGQACCLFPGRVRGLLGRRPRHFQRSCPCRRSAPALGSTVALFFAGISQQLIKENLRQNTDELVARGGFGSPTVYLDRDDMYFFFVSLPKARRPRATKAKAGDSWAAVERPSVPVPA